MKGEFENRLRQVIEEVQSSPKPIILFIDEAHTLIGAGGAAGTGDAANLLKPALARGTLRTIAATTWAEYKKYFEKDPALTRRFQVVQVDEPDEDEGDPDDARHRLAAGEAPPGADAGRGDRGRGASCRTATSRRASCPTSRSACSTPPAPASRSASTPRPPAVEDCRRRIEALQTELEIIARETRDRHRCRRARRRAPATALERRARGPGPARAGNALGRREGAASIERARKLRAQADAAGAEAGGAASAAPPPIASRRAATLDELRGAAGEARRRTRASRR